MRNPLKLKLHWQILAAILAAAAVCVILRTSGTKADWLMSACATGGTLFIRALKMVIVPLVASSIVGGMMAMGSAKGFGRMGAGVLGYYTFTSLASILTGLVLVNLIGPGRVSQETASLILGQASEKGGDIAQRMTGSGTGTLTDFFERLIPVNIIQSATDNGQLLGLIVFCIAFGYFAAGLEGPAREFQQRFWDGAQTIMMRVTGFVVAFSPIGVFCLILPVIDRAGLTLVLPVMIFALTVFAGLALHMLITLSLLMRKIAGVNPLLHLRTMLPVLLTAFSTASSSATLPVTMETVEKDSGVSGRVCGFTLPLGATVNMDGTALYECVVVLFVAQLYGSLQGFELSVFAQAQVVIMALLTSVGVAGIPSASLVAIALILSYVGLPVEAVGVVWLVDRVLDMCRTAVNVYSDTCGAIIIGKLAGEKGIYAAPPAKSED